MPVWNLEVFICRSFIELDDSASFVAGLDPSLKQQWIPLLWIPALETPSQFRATNLDTKAGSHVAALRLIWDSIRQ